MYGVVWERQKEQFMYCGERHIWRGETGRSGLRGETWLLTRAKLGVHWSVAAARVQVWVHGSAAALICVDVHSSWNHIRQRGKSCTGLMVSLTVWNPRENGSCVSSCQHSGSGPVDRVMGEPGLQSWAWEICPSSALWYHGLKRDAAHWLWQMGELSRMS